MSHAYQETIEGESMVRPAPGLRHETICARLHECVKAAAADIASTRLLPRRTPVTLSPHTMLCPDLALVTVANGRLWLAAEVISSEDHRPDTVIKKQVYEDLKVPRLWMIDPRYDNIEVYHGGEYGLALKAILAGRQILEEKLLPEFQLTVADLFYTAPPQS